MKSSCQFFACSVLRMSAMDPRRIGTATYHQQCGRKLFTNLPKSTGTAPHSVTASAQGKGCDAWRQSLRLTTKGSWHKRGWSSDLGDAECRKGSTSSARAMRSRRSKTETNPSVLGQFSLYTHSGGLSNFIGVAWKLVLRYAGATWGRKLPT